MSERSPRRPSVGFVIRIAGHLDPHWSAWFGNCAVTPESDGTTSLEGVVVDQAELHGLLVKVRDLGIALLSVDTAERTET